MQPLGIPGDGFRVTSPEVPQPVFLYQRDDRVVIAYGEQAAKDALDPAGKLVDSSEYKDATASLEDGYTVATFLAIPPILELVESTPLAADADFQQVKSYLEPLGALFAAGKKDGDDLDSLLRLTVP